MKKSKFTAQQIAFALKPPWIGREVMEDSRYFNLRLAASTYPK